MALAHRSFQEQALHYFTRPHTGLPAGPVQSPADWRGPQMMAHEQDWLLEFSQAQIDSLEQAGEAAIASGIDMQSLTVASFDLGELNATLQAQRQAIEHGRGFVVLRGLPVERWGVDLSSFVYWGIGHHLGVPGAQNPQGELLGHVIDYGEEDDNPVVRRYRTSGNIDFHCDAADVVGLLCLQTARTGGQSRIASSVALFNAVHAREPELIARLFEPFAMDRRGEQGPDEPGFIPIPPCCWDGKTLRTFYHSEYFRSAERLDEVTLDDGARQLLDLYDEFAASEEFYLDMWLQPGDMQFISNHTTVHSRTAYEDWPQRDKKRHLLRLWLSL